MSWILGLLAALLGIQAVGLASRLPGLLIVPRATARSAWPLFALLGAGACAAGIIGGPPIHAIAGVIVGLPLAVVIPSVRPLCPDERLLAGSRMLPLPGHPDAGARLLMPAMSPRAVVVVAHGGGNDRSFGLWHMAPRLLERGCAIALAHLPGHGMGGSDALTVEAARERIDALTAAARAAVPVPIIGLGQSVGGGLILDAVARNVPFDGAITVSAAIRLELSASVLREVAVAASPAAWRALRYATVAELMPAVGRFHRRRFPVRVAPGAHYLVALAEVVAALDLVVRLRQAQPPYPVLLVHGGTDGIIPVEQAREVAAALGDRGRLAIFDGLHHLDPLFDEGVICRIIEYIDEILERRQAS